LSFNYEAIVNGVGTDWSNTELEDLIKNYINDSAKWSHVSAPAFAKLEFKDTVGFAGLGTYQINVVDTGGEIDYYANNGASYMFKPTFRVEIFARKPNKYGKSFPELNNIQNQIINIFMNFPKNKVAGFIELHPSGWSEITLQPSVGHTNDVWNANVFLRGTYVKTWKVDN